MPACRIKFQLLHNQLQKLDLRGAVHGLYLFPVRSKSAFSVKAMRDNHLFYNK